MFDCGQKVLFHIAGASYGSEVFYHFIGWQLLVD